jgi:hypothetical protein
MAFTDFWSILLLDSVVAPKQRRHVNLKRRSTLFGATMGGVADLADLWDER